MRLRFRRSCLILAFIPPSLRMRKSAISAMGTLRSMALVRSKTSMSDQRLPSFQFFVSSIIDFEASALGPQSYPIEVGVVDCSTVASLSWLIKPVEGWLRDGVWSDESAAVHRIALSEILKNGVPLATVAHELENFCRDKTVLCDGGEHDLRWLVTLYAAIDKAPPFELSDHQTFAWDLFCQANRRPDIAVSRAEWEALSRFPSEHRAGADARRLAEVVRLIAGRP